MRKLIALVGVLALLWGGYWFVGATAMERALMSWLEDRREDGWQAEAANVRTSGFPNRFDTTFTGLQLADPKAGMAWTAPFFQILSLSYRPNHVIVVFPQAHSLATPRELIEMTSSDARGSVVLEADSLLALDRSSFVAKDFAAHSSAGWSFDMDELRLATRHAPGAALSHQIALSSKGFVPGGSWSEIAREAGLPDEVRDLSADAVVSFSAPWDRYAIERGRPQPTRIELRNLRAEWGELLLQVTGTVDVDPEGLPTGTVAVQARNWQDIVDLLRDTGALPEEVIPTLERALSMLAGLSGNPAHIDATLRLAQGRIAVGPVSVGPVIRLRLR